MTYPPVAARRLPLLLDAVRPLWHLGTMWHLYQFPLCPFSPKVRLLMSEKGIAYELQTEKPWDGRDGFFAMNPAGRVPVLQDEERAITLADSRAICEYLEETVERNPLISGTAQQRAEIRRLRAGLRESPLVPHEQTLTLLRQMDELRAQVGVEFPV
jgi:glutathione S-transferase